MKSSQFWNKRIYIKSAFSLLTILTVRDPSTLHKEIKALPPTDQMVCVTTYKGLHVAYLGADEKLLSGSTDDLRRF